MAYVVRATDGNGKQFFYTGCKYTGPGRIGDWLTENKSEAFTYFNPLSARTKIKRFVHLVEYTFDVVEV